MLVGWVVEVQPGWTVTYRTPGVQASPPLPPWEVHVAAEFDDDDDALSFATRVRAILDAL